MEIAIPVLFITFIVIVIIIPQIIDACFMKETDKLIWKKDEEKNKKGEK